MTINRNKKHDREQTAEIIQNTNRQAYSGGENWLGHGLRGGGAAYIDAMLLDGASMPDLLKQRGGIYEHFSHLRNEHGLLVEKIAETYRFDRVDLKAHGLAEPKIKSYAPQMFDSLGKLCGMKESTAKSVTLLMDVYQGNTFVSALATALAIKGLTKEEYVRIAKVFGTSQARFAAYISHFKNKGFNLVLEGDRYFERPVQDPSTGSLIQKTEHLKLDVSKPEAVAAEITTHGRLRNQKMPCARNITLVHSREDYEWAKRAAVDEWNGGEGEMHGGILNVVSNYNGEKLFGAFLTKFSIARCITKVGKPLLLKEYISNWRGGWENAKPGDIGSYQSVDRFARLISEKGWASKKGTMSSLASKMAFMSNPSVFFPCDNYSIKGLSRCGLRPALHDYPAYMSALMEISKYLPGDLEIDLPLLMPKMKRCITQSTLRMRILDKLMMKVGGFQQKGMD